MKVELTVPQIEVLRSIAGEVFGADGPEDWSDLTGRTPAEASREWRTLERADKALSVALRSKKRGAK